MKRVLNNNSIKILKSISGNVRFALSGKHHANMRQYLMSDIMGKKMPKSKCGINSLNYELLKFANIITSEKCLAEILNLLAIWVNELSFEEK